MMMMMMMTSLTVSVSSMAEQSVNSWSNHFSITVMSPNIARPLTLRTSPSDFATFNQIKSFLIFNIRLLFESEK